MISSESNQLDGEKCCDQFFVSFSAMVQAINSTYTQGVLVGGYRINLGTGFAWYDGSPWNAFDMGNWQTGEPNNAGGVENVTELQIGTGN
jgi:hypothetical protein